MLVTGELRGPGIEHRHRSSAEQCQARLSEEISVTTNKRLVPIFLLT